MAVFLPMSTTALCCKDLDLHAFVWKSEMHLHLNITSLLTSHCLQDALQLGDLSICSKINNYNMFSPSLSFELLSVLHNDVQVNLLPRKSQMHLLLIVWP